MMWTATMKELQNLIYEYGELKNSLVMAKIGIDEAIELIQNEEYEEAVENLIQLLGEI